MSYMSQTGRDAQVYEKLESIVHRAETARHYLAKGQVAEADHEICVIHELGIDIAELLGFVEPMHTESF
jgi:hypothetical protein